MSQHGYDTSHPAEAARIIAGITHGIDVEYVGDRAKPKFGPNLPIEEDDIVKVSAIIAADVAALKKAGPYDRMPFPNLFVSPIGCVPKKNGKIRVIHHLSYPFKGDSVNADIVDVSVQLASVAEAIRHIRRLGPGCYLIKLDVEAAYKQVPVRPEDWHLLGFKWLGKYYYERVLPFGLKSSCRLWDLYAAALHHFFEKMGVEVVVHYVDDFLFIVQCKNTAQRNLTEALALCEELGVPMAADKTEGPVTCLTFLGIELDTVAMTARLPLVKLLELQQLIMEWTTKTHATAKEITSIAGKLTFACSVVRPGRFFMGRLWSFAALATSLTKRSIARLQLAAAARADIMWWHQCLTGWNGISLFLDREWTDSVKLELTTDACTTGYGVLCGSQWIAGTWTAKHRAAAVRKTKESMPFYELYALVVASAAFGHQWRGKKILFRCDCMPVVQAIQKRSSRNPASMHLLRYLSLTAARNEFDFRCEHIPGVQNVAADLLSRYGDKWGVDARRFARAAIADTTRRTYAAATKSYGNFCQRHGWSFHPITTEHAVRWLAELGVQGHLMGDSIAGYRSALSTCHREHTMGEGDNPLTSTAVTTVIEGIRRTLHILDVKKRNAQPQTMVITPTLLRDIEHTMPSDEPLATMAYAAASVAVYAMLRPSELLGTPPARDRALKLEQITFYTTAGSHAIMPLHPKKFDIDRASFPDRFTVKLHIAKNDQFGMMHPKPVAGPAAVRALWRWCHLRRTLGAGANTRLFECTGYAPLSGAELLRRITAGLAGIGYRNMHITGKCFRKGGATGLAADGASNEEVAALAGWRTSSMVETYATREALEDRRIATSRRLAPALPSSAM